ncbi:MAG: hypothetical protein FJ264_10770, partial [Planctomycetes bacterium]|nr:hypothetical protein [Planctomycetota bacterium]
LVIFLFSQIHFVKEVGAQSGGAGSQWEAVPLRTSAQYEAGHEGGEGFQMVQSISYAPSNPDVAYFCVDTSQVWKSIDGGNSWESKRNGIKSLGGVSLVVDSGNEDVVFLSSTGGGSNDGIYRTLDGGDTWTLVRKTYYSKNTSGDTNDAGEGQHYAFDANSFDGTRHQTIYAGTHKDGLLKSTDGGATWKSIGLSGKRILDIELVTSGGTKNTLYVATNNTAASSKGLYKVVDDGVNTPTVSALGNLPDYPRTIAIDTESNSSNVIIYAAVGTYKVYRSTDGGKTFTSRSSGLDLNCSYRTISISPADPNYLYVRVDVCSETYEFNPYYSTDGGATWNPAYDLNVGDLDIQDIWPGPAIPIAPHPEIAGVALGDMLSSMRKTTDSGNSWSYSGNGYMGARREGGKSSVYFDTSDTRRRIYFLTDFGPAITEDGGNTWRLLGVPRNNGQTTRAGAVSPDNSDIIVTAVGSYNSQYIIRSADGGNSWTKYTSTSDDYYFMSFHPQNSSYVYAGGESGSRISKDGGKTWTSVSGKGIHAVFPGNGDIVYAFEQNPNKTNSSYLWYSADKGTTWSQIATNPFGMPQDVDIDPTDSNMVYAATTNGLYVFDGSGWQEIGKSNGITGETFGSTTLRSFSAVAVDPINPNNIYVGMKAGSYGHFEKFIFRSQDYGNTWEDIRYDQTGYSSVWSLNVDPLSGDLHMCNSHGNYILRKGPEVAIVSPSDGASVNTTPVTVRYTVNGGSEKSVSKGLTEGENNVTVTETDAEGNTGSATITVTLDTAVPQIAIVSPSNGATVNTNPVTVTYTVDGGSQKTVSKSLAEGKNTVTVTETDTAGNKGSASITVTLDTTAPVINIVSPTDGAVVNTNPVTVTYTVDGGSQKTVSKSLTEGKNTITISETDSVGNKGSASITVTLDTAVPVIKIVSPTDGAVVNTSPLTVTYTVDGGSQKTVSRSLTEGTNTVTITGTDSAGNTGSASINVTLDTVAPKITIVSPVEGATVNSSPVEVTYTVDGESAISLSREESLWAYYNFEEGSGTVANDSSVNKRNGTIYGDATYTTGKKGKGLKCDGTNDYVEIGDIDLSDAFTLSAWIKASSFGKNMIIGKTWETYQLLVKDGGTIVVSRNSANAISYRASLATNTWYHIVATFDTTNGTVLYVDGNEVATSGNTSVTTKNDVATKIGATGWTAQDYFNGIVDEVRIFNRALTSGEVYDLFSGQTTVSKSITEGRNTITVTETDQAGNTGTASINITLDTGAPQITILSPSDGAVVNTSPITVTYTVDGGSQKTVSKSLTEGANTITISETDSSGNTGSASITVTLDTTVPVVTIVSPTDGAVVNTNPLTVTYTVDGGSQKTVSKSLTEGTNMVTVTETDSAGNTGSTSITVMLDTTAPQITILSPSDGTVVDVNSVEVTYTVDGQSALSMSREDSLWAYYNFEEGSGTVAYDSSVYKRDGTIYGNAAYGTGKKGKGLKCDGVNDYAEIGDIDLSDAFTLSTWIKASSFGKNMIVGKTYETYQLFVSTGGTVVFNRNSASAIRYRANLATNTWYHIVVTFDTTNGTALYVDGSSVATEGTTTVTSTNDVATRIGAAGWTAMDFFNGIIDDVRIFNRSLSAEEVEELFSDKTTVVKNLVEGENVITVAETDLAGNTGSASITVTLDTIAPQITILSPSDGAMVNSSPITVAYTVDGGSQKTVSKSLTEGKNTITISETDSLGKTGSASITVTLDTIAPQVTIVSPKDGAEVSSSPIDVTYTIDGGSQKTVSKSLTEGTNTVTISETDSAGNTGSASITVTLNTLSTATNSKVACYAFDEGSGSVATDTSGNGNDGTINGGAVFSTGKSGTGLSFDGTDDYVSVPCMNYDEISISAWFYKNKNDTSNADAIIGGWKWNSDIQSNEGFDVRFFKNNPDTIDFCLITKDANGTRTKMTASSNLGSSTGAWHHVVCTYSQSTGEQKLYINGTLAATVNHSAGNKIVPLSSYSDMRIGYSRVNNGYFNGKIDEVYIYDRALSDQEVLDVFNGK